ncbi:DUF2808 domain-containing protein [Trichothermofontia sp.]
MTRRWLSLAFGGLAATMATITANRLPVAAVQLADGMTAFVQQPVLLDATTTHNTARAWVATYYFNMQLPAGASEPLQRLQIDQKQGVELIGYRLNKTRAYEGSRSRRGEPLAIGEQSFDRRTGQLTVIFDPPIPPGTQFTLALQPVQNPMSGIYLLGVTAFPAGDRAMPHFMGFGRLHFYSDWF